MALPLPTNITIPQAAHLAHHNDVHAVVNDAASKAAANTFTQPQSATRIKVKESPWVDVTHPNYGAVGDNTTDDAAAITAAILAAHTGGGAVFFPPNIGYKINSTINLTGKRHSHLLGGRGPMDTAAPFATAPQVRITPAPGITAFLVDAAGGGSDNITLENISVRGGACCFLAKDTALLYFKNCGLEPAADASANNAPVVLENSFWVRFDTCALNGVPNKFSAILRGKSPVFNVDSTYLVTFRSCIFVSGGVKYEQNVTPSSQPGSLQFFDCWTEGADNALLHITKDPAVTFSSFKLVTIDGFEHYDANPIPPVIRLDSSGTNLQMVRLSNVISQPAIEVLAGAVLGIRLDSPRGASSVVTGAGARTGSYSAARDYGTDYIGTALASTNTNWDDNATAAIRLGMSAEAHARFTGDHDGKLRWGPGGASGGIDTLLERTGVGTLAVAADDCLKTGRAATGSRPSASTVGAGGMFYDTTLQKPIWSDGTAWRDATGTTV